MARTTGERRLEARVYGCLSDAYVALGRPDRALAFCTQQVCTFIDILHR